MSSVHECDMNNRHDTKSDKFAWHNKILTNPLWFIRLFVNVNEQTHFTYNVSAGTPEDTLTDCTTFVFEKKHQSLAPKL